MKNTAECPFVVGDHVTEKNGWGYMGPIARLDLIDGSWWATFKGGHFMIPAGKLRKAWPSA